MIIKVCGMRDPDNIRAVEQLAPDWMGFIFFPKSSRYVSELPEYMPSRCKRVGVFVNEEVDIILQKAETFGLSAAQLHGQETPGLCRKLRGRGLEVIKVFSVTDGEGLQSTLDYEECCDYFLFDTACSGYGGSGRRFRWDVLQAYGGKTPFLLSGGIGPDSIEALLRFHHPRWVGIDLNSGFETAPAQKNITLLYTFIEQIKQKIK